MPKIKKSWVWNYLIDNGKTATCQFCKKEYKSISNNFMSKRRTKLRDDTLDNLSFSKGIMKMEPQHLLTYN